MGTEFRGRGCDPRIGDREFIGVEVTLDANGIETTGDETTVSAEVGGKGFNGPSHFTFAVRDDRVARMTIRA